MALSNDDGSLFCTWEVSTVKKNRISAMRGDNSSTTSTSPDTSSMTASTPDNYDSAEAVVKGGRCTEEYTSEVDSLSSILAQACHIDAKGVMSRLLRESSMIVQWRRKREIYTSYIDVRSISGAGRAVVQPKKRMRGPSDGREIVIHRIY